MTTKYIKIALFASLIVAMILPFNGMNYVTAERPIGLEDATEEQLSEYNLVAPLLEELYSLDSEGRAFYAEKSTLTDADVKYLENTEIRIREIQATLGKLSADQRELYAMDMATEAKFMASQKAFVESGLEFSGVYVDQKTATLNIAVPENLSDKAYEIKKQIEQIIDVPYVLKFADFHDAACSTRESNCDPIVGGIEINDNCSIGLPVIRNVFWWTEDGFITAGHCTSGGAIISATSTNVFHGIVKGYVGGDTAGPKWSKIDAALDLQ